MNKIFFLLIACIFIASCSNYSVVNEEINKNYSKCVVSVRLQDKVDELKLADISNKIRSDRKSYDHLFILFYLPGMKLGSGAWANAKFTPDLKIQILGSSEEVSKSLDNVTVENKEIIGRWRDHDPISESAIVIFKDNDTLKIKTVYKDGSDIINSIIKKQENNKTIYTYSDPSMVEYIVEENNGDLSFYGSTGKYGEAKKIN